MVVSLNAELAPFICRSIQACTTPNLRIGGRSRADAPLIGASNRLRSYNLGRRNAAYTTCNHKQSITIVCRSIKRRNESVYLVK